MVFKKIDKLEAYKTYGTRIGANANNKAFDRFVFKRIPNKFTILNIKLIDERIKLAAKFLSNYNRKNILLVSTLDSAYYAVYNFSKLMKVSVNFGRYLAGSMTNVSYKNFFEPKVLLITDPKSNRRAINDAKKINIPIVGIANTDNSTSFIDMIIPGNNKSGNSIGLILFLLAINMARKDEKEKIEKITLEDFVSKELEF
ncbi:MAG: Ribosomal protein S2 [Candidatus Parvarchaeum acidophilus ARMAN-5_'5-way FS']|jgi:small subunit ribosomal protein S2|uniref:Ribosomal protein S2 n=2 Tax=Parvarchaeum acidophilus TaxID=662761 RepID=D6GWA1_PARA5|nr:MAG: ribosomal protein S2 [Candidatus Parvarchaeum acidophilus ARMAN-5]EGD71918.1 MAG: Ribosomal protein S2 [Candidatus Parvarchaeum acidophilus ARMAN-5_'5-way FS']